MYPSWSLDGKRLLFNDVSDYDAMGRLLEFDETGRPVGKAQPLPQLGPNRWVRWASEAGKLLFCAPPGTAVFLFDLQTSTRTLLTPAEPGCVKHYPDLSCDVTKLVYGYSKGLGQPISVYAAPADGSPDGRVLLGEEVHTHEVGAFWAPEDDRVAYGRAGRTSFVATFGGKRRTVELQVQKPGGPVEGAQATVPVTVSLRNVTRQPQQVHLEVRLSGAQRTLETAPADLEVPPKEIASHTFEVRPGARGTYRGVVSARGEAFEVEAPFSFGVTEGWGDKTPVAVLPFAPTAKESREELAAGCVTAVALEGVLSRLWQLNVLPNGSVLSRLEHSDSDFFTLNSHHGGQRVGTPVGSPVSQPVRGTGPELPATDAETLKRRCQTFKHSAYLISGTAGYAGGKLRIEAALVQVSTATVKPDSTVTVEGELAQLPDLIAQLAAGLMQKLDVALEPEQTALLKPGLSANPDALKQYGEARLLAGEGQRDKAAAALQQCLTVDPSFGLAHQAMGLFHLSQWKVSEASTEFQIAQSLDPHDLRARECLLRSRTRTGFVESAEKEVEAFLADYPLNPSAHVVLAMFRMVRGRNRETVEHYQLAQRDPYLREELGAEIEQILSQLYLKDLSLDPKLAAEVEVEFQDKPLKEVLDALGKAGSVTLITAVAPDQPVTLHLGKVKLGAALMQIVAQVPGKWTRTEQGYFLVARQP
jgi:tetratricopeptide (TPR) repeat protein